MTNAAEKDEVPVLIAGGGMVGLSAATFLAQQGVRSVAIERLEGELAPARAAFFHMRTMEMFRSVGVEGAGSRTIAEGVRAGGRHRRARLHRRPQARGHHPEPERRRGSREPLPPPVPESTEPRADPARTRAQAGRHGDPGRRKSPASSRIRAACASPSKTSPSGESARAAREVPDRRRWRPLAVARRCSASATTAAASSRTRSPSTSARTCRLGSRTTRGASST